MLKRHDVFYTSEIPEVTWYEPLYNWGILTYKGSRTLLFEAIKQEYCFCAFRTFWKRSWCRECAIFLFLYWIISINLPHSLNLLDSAPCNYPFFHNIKIYLIASHILHRKYTTNLQIVPDTLNNWHFMEKDSSVENVLRGSLNKFPDFFFSYGHFY